MTDADRSWRSLSALMLGFFMIMLDSTIVAVANPAIMRGLHLTSYSSVMWVTSAYLLASAVPLLITGRLGDRYGPKNIFIIGMAIFIVSSAACGLSGTMGGGLAMLVTARVVQGVGAGLMTPQTMAIITRTFPPDRRGPAMGLWGAVGGVAGLVGPLAGGLLTDALGWEWIFFINVPIGIVAIVAVAAWVPKLPIHQHSFDIFGVVLSAIGLFLLIFGVQEGEQYDWGTVVGPITVWDMIGAGIVLLVIFMLVQGRKAEPLLPLRLFKDRNFSVATGTITLLGAASTCMSLPMLYFFQLVRGMSPTESALMVAPSAIVSFFGAPMVGRRLRPSNAKWIAFGSMVIFIIGLGMWALAASPSGSLVWLLLASAVIGVANSGMYSPVSTSATRDLAASDAGAGAGVYNTTRQIGSVLGTAGITALISWAVSVDVPGSDGGSVGAMATVLPTAAQAGFSTAMVEALMLPVIAVLIAAGVILLLRGPVTRPVGMRPAEVAGSEPGGFDIGANEDGELVGAGAGGGIGAGGIRH